MRLFFLLFTLVLVSISITVSAQTRQIKDLENKRKLALREIENTTLLLTQTKKNASTLLSRINLLSEQINSRQRVISLLEQEVKEINKQQAITEKEIKDLEVKLKDQQAGYAKALESMALRKQGSNELIFILSGKSVTESFRRMKYIKDYSEWRTGQITGIREKQKDLKEKKESLNRSKEAKINLLASREKEQNKLLEEEEVHKREVDEAGKKQKELEDILVKKQKQADNLNAQIEKLIAQEVQRQEREAKRQTEISARRERERRRREQADTRRRNANNSSNNTKTDEESTPRETASESPKDVEKPEISRSVKPATQENIVLSSNFSSNKGKLPMPVTGKYTIIGHFGTHKHDKFRVTTNNGGIDIQAQSGSQARSVFDGEVTRIVAFPGYNNCIIIRHGGYYTFYGNIQQIAVSQGQKVKAGQALGQIYADSDTGNAQLHFQLWQGTSKLNPEPWLKK